MAKRKQESCIWLPKVPRTNETSKLYKGMIDLGIDRPIVNYVYAKYTTTNAADIMDSQGYSKDALGQHKAKDVVKFFNVMEIQNASLTPERTRNLAFGVADANGNPIEFTAEDAFAKAKEINDTSETYVAKVVKIDDKFQVVTEVKDSRTQVYTGETNRAMEMWQAFSEKFTQAGIDVEALKTNFAEIVNPLDITSFLQYLNALRSTSPNHLTDRDIKLLLVLGKDIPSVDALLTKRGWGDLNAVTDKIGDILANPSNYASSLVTFVKDALKEAERANASVYSDTMRAIQDKSYEVRGRDESYKIQHELEKLHQKYHINAEILIKTGKDIKSLTDAAVEAMFSLERQIRNIRTKEGKTAIGQDLENNLKTLQKELANKNYYVGLLSYLNRAKPYVETVSRILNGVPTAGTPLEIAVKSAAAVAKATALRGHYYEVVKALSRIETLKKNESMSTQDAEELKRVASEILVELEKHEDMMKELRRSVVSNVAVTYLGDNVVNGIPLANLLNMAENDSTMFDYLYSCERVSDPILSCLGTVIRDAQQVRDQQTALIYQEMRACKRRLGNQRTDFMFEKLDDGKIMIKSKYDWNRFNKARNQEWGNLKNLGLDGFALQDEMEKWEAANMEDEIVDPTTGRTERVPSSLYLKYPNLPDDFFMNTNGVEWTPEQKRYYKEMMAIKGKIGTLLPYYAQQQYLPVQVRAEWTEVVERGIRQKTPMNEVVANIRERMKETMRFDLKEGDKSQKEDFGYLPHSENIDMVYSNYDDYLLKKIPLYFVSPMKEQSNVSLDFTAALESLASTAFNYSAMNGIKDTVDTMADFLKERRTAENTRGGKRAFDVIEDTSITAVKQIAKKANATKTPELIDGWVASHFYGERIRKNSRTGRIVQALLGYTSLNNLAPNLKGGISNYLVGEFQMMVEGLAGALASKLGGKEDAFYNLKNYAWAHKLMFGDKFGKGALMDHLTNDVTSKGHLLEQFFDPLQELSSELGHNVYDSVFQRLFGGFNPMFIYSSGESLIHLTNMYAVLDNIKVLVDGKKTSLYKALERDVDQDKNVRLKVKDNTTTLDGQAVDAAFLQKVKDKIRLINQLTHGSMNAEDKGIIHRSMVGRAVMQFRQWMVEHYSRRYRGRYFDGTTKQWREGYWTTMGKFLWSFYKDYSEFGLDVAARWDSLDAVQKMNISRTISEIGLFSCLVLLSFGLGEPDKDKQDFWYRMLIYQVKRLIFDEQASMPASYSKNNFTPVGPISEGIKLLNSPVASVSTLRHIIYPISGLLTSDVHEKYQKGKHKGKNKYWTKVKKYAIPFYNQLEQLYYFDKDDSVFKVFEPDL